MALDCPTTRMNYANSLFYQEKYSDADAQYALAIKGMRDHLDDSKKSKDTNEHAEAAHKLGQALMLRAYSLAKLGMSDAALTSLQEGIERYESVDDTRMAITVYLARIEFHGKAAELYELLAYPTKALQHADSALEALGKTVRLQDADRYWESLLGQWQRLPGRKVRNELSVRGRGYAKRALITAEASKGRLLYRQMEGDKAIGQFDALDETRQARAVKRVTSWCRDSSKARFVVSLFADHAGLSLFVLGQGGRVFANCESRFAYLQWLKNRMNPWDDAIETYDPYRFAAVEQGMLSELGSALWRTCPGIAEGGEELIVLPHKALRNLPLQHAILPEGKRLAELFDRVFVYPTMWDFAECLRSGAGQTSIREVCGCVDPDGSLPFARLEGFLCCHHNRLASGKQVTAEAIEQLSGKAGILLLSCHGSFNMNDPWQSTLRLANEDLRVMDFAGRLQLPEVVVLGACESGLSRRSASDEPVSFAGVLLRRNVKAVVAPLWPVDDCSSALFMTRFFEEIDRCGDLSKSVKLASAMLRDMTVNEAREQFRRWIDRIEEAEDSDLLDKKRILEQMSLLQAWLNTLAGDALPWSMLDWGAYQLVGGYTEVE